MIRVIITWLIGVGILAYAIEQGNYLLGYAGIITISIAVLLRIAHNYDKEQLNKEE